jgi:hypothetical protein
VKARGFGMAHRVRWRASIHIPCFGLSVSPVKVVRHKVGLEAVEKEKQLPFWLVSGTAPVISRASGLF